MTKKSEESAVGLASPIVKRDGKKSGIRLRGKEGVFHSFESAAAALVPHAKRRKCREKDWEYWAVKESVANPKSKTGVGPEHAVFVFQVWPHTAGADLDKKERLAKLRVRFKLEGEVWVPMDLFSFKGHPFVLHALIRKLDRDGAPKIPITEPKVFEVVPGIE